MGTTRHEGKVQNGCLYCFGSERVDTLLSYFSLNQQLIDWSYMDFSTLAVRVGTTLRTIKDLLKERHGGNIAQLTIFKDSHRETNELRADEATLKECGIDGGPKDAAPVVTLHYDFTPDGCAEPDPILMC